MTVEVQSYATIGLRLWAAAKAPHGRACPCLICADTRRYLGESRLVAITLSRRRRVSSVG